MRFVRSLFGKNSNEIKIGDLVEQYRHYEYNETRGAILKPGPASETAGTKWRFRGFGTYKNESKLVIKELKQFSNYYDELSELELDEEPVVELELIDGKFQHFVRFQESESPQNDSKQLEMLQDEKKAEEVPGYILQINSSLGYRKSFPKKSLVQQFFDEWRKVA